MSTYIPAMKRWRVRAPLVIILAIVFALASLWHGPTMAAGAAPLVDCHGTTGGHDQDRSHDRQQPPVAVMIGCPLANLAAPPTLPSPIAQRFAVRSPLASSAPRLLKSISLDPVDPPPRAA